MGIVNITPDSFSDGNNFLKPESAIAHAHSLISDGCDVLDLGAESTRPGAAALSWQEEWQRLEPVLRGLKAEIPPSAISVDTRNPEVMLRAAQLGVGWINNVNGLADQETLKKLASYNLNYIAMHMHGNPKTMQDQALSRQDCATAVERFFSEAHEKLLACGFTQDRIFMDPGIGFGKTDAANLMLMSKAGDYSKAYNLVFGVSRKSMFGRLLDIPEPLERDKPSKVAEFALAMAGVNVIRTHNVKELAKINRVFSKV